MEILSSIGTFIAKAIATPLMFVLSVAGFGGTDTNVGATLPSATAVFETSLASPISSSATSMTLTANSVRGGGTLSGYNCFVIDEGSAQAEFICGTVTGTTVASLLRGVSPTTGTTTITALQFSHRRGSNVKISDFPLIQILKAQNNGEETFPNKLTYTTSPTFLNNNEIVDKAYVDSVAFGSLPVSVTSGGTGASTFPSGGFLFGNGTSAIGASSSPTVGWLNATSTTATSTLAGFLNVTGTNSTSTFSGNVSLTATTSIKADSSNRLIANNLSYAFPSARGASSSVLTEDGLGTLRFLPLNPPRYTFSTTSSTWTATTGTVSTSTGFFTVPAGVLTASSTIELIMNISSCSTGGGSGSCYASLRNSAGTTMASSTIGAGSAFGNSGDGFTRMLVRANNSLSSQTSQSYGFCVYASSAAASGVANGCNSNTNTSTINTAGSLSFAVTIQAQTGATAVATGYTIIVNP